MDGNHTLHLLGMLPGKYEEDPLYYIIQLRFDPKDVHRGHKREFII